MLDVDTLVNSAKNHSRISHFGNMSFYEGLTQLVHSLNKDAKLNEYSETHVGEHLTQMLVNRLRMDKDIQQHPEILDIEILPPIVITSLPRTGSTKLHRMLAATGDFFSLQTWQEYNFSPFPDANPNQPDPRIQAAHNYIDWFKSRAPAALEAHPMEAEEVEEELLLLAATMRSPFLHHGNYDVSSFIDWVMQQDVRNTYQDLRRMLQYLQWQHYPGQTKPWVLKSPSHLGAEQAFNDVFPNTQFIVSHRNILKVIPSVCSLMCKMREAYSSNDFSQQAGVWGTTVFPQLIASHMDWCDNNPNAQVFNVGYKDIKDDEIDVLKKIYTFTGQNISEEAIERTKLWLDADQKTHVTTHKYKPEDFGITADTIKEAFQKYSSKYSAYI